MASEGAERASELAGRAAEVAGMASVAAVEPDNNLMLNGYVIKSDRAAIERMK